MVKKLKQFFLIVFLNSILKNLERKWTSKNNIRYLKNSLVDIVEYYKELKEQKRSYIVTYHS